jgi:hypothetical protein
MTKELQTLNERIADRIGKDLVELIPKQQWKDMVDAEIHKFVTVVAPKIIQEQLTEAYKLKVKAIVDSYVINDDFDQLSNIYVNTKLKELIAASGGEIFAGILNPAMQQVMLNLRSQLGRY